MNLYNYLKSTIGISGNILPLRVLASLTRQNIVLPFYHSVSDKTPSHIKNIYTSRTVKQFIKDLDYLCKHFKPVCIEQLYNNIKNGIYGKRIFHLTFDDGLSEFYYEAAPILEKKGIPATVFLNSDFLDNKNMFYRYKVSLIIETLKKITNQEEVAQILTLPRNASKDSIIKAVHSLDDTNVNTINKLIGGLDLNIKDYLKNKKPYMNSTQIKDLLSRGFSIGSHSVNHPHFINLSLEEQKRQVSESFKVLEDEFGLKQRYFSFPFSDEGVSKSFFIWLFVQQKCKLSFGTTGFKNDILPFHLHRISMEAKNSTARFLLKRKYMLYLLNAPFGNNSILRD